MTESSVEKCVLTQTKESPHATFTSESDAHHGMVHCEFVPQEQTVNQHFYKEVLTHLVNKIRQKRKLSGQEKLGPCITTMLLPTQLSA